MIYGVDLHPSFQAGISIPQIQKEGFEFIICKLSQGSNKASYAGSIPWIKQARSLGMEALGYHYLMNGNVEAQADAFVAQLKAAGVNGAIDAEDGSGDIINIRTFYNAVQRRGGKIALLYLPRWYWTKIGKPGLAGLPPLWSSRYPDMTVGTASANYARVPADFWDGYGTLNVELLQFSSAARVAGHTVDANAYKGSKEQLVDLFGSASPTVKQLGGFLMALNDSEQTELLGLVRTIDTQLRGAGAKGWPAWQGGTVASGGGPESLTLVDFARRDNTRVEDLHRKIDAIAKELASSGQIETPTGIDQDALVAAVTSAVKDVLSHLQIVHSDQV